MAEHVPAQRLIQALQLWEAHRQTPVGSDAEFLARHDDLRDLLEPLVTDLGTEPEPTDPQRPREFGSFRLLRELGRGGVGVVHAALQLPLARQVALKLLAAPLVFHPQAVARFRREAELLARLQHPHIVPVFDAGVVDGVPYHAMELVDGCGLHEVVHVLQAGERRRDGRALADALAQALRQPGAGERLVGSSYIDAVLRLVHTVATALQAAHAAGILHRDVKPANILLRTDGTALLSDFGLARDEREPGLTSQGGFAGTPYYVSPEQAAGDAAAVGPPSDIFSLAVVLYELLLLERPFDGDTTEAVLASVREAEPPALRCSADLPVDLAAVLERALQKHPADRYASMAEFADELHCIVELRPVRARRSGRLGRWLRRVRRRPMPAALGAALALSALSAVVLFVYLRLQQPRLAAAAEAEALPQVERLLEAVVMEWDAGDVDRAIALADAAARLLPDLPEVVTAQTVLRLTDVGLPGAAAPFLDHLRQVAPDVALQLTAPQTGEPVSALGWFVRGIRQLEKGHGGKADASYADAAAALRRAMDRAPAPRCLFHCQYLHALTHRRDTAAVRELADDILHLWPQSPFAAYWRGFALLSVEPELARQELERAMALAPDLPQPARYLAKYHENKGELARAEQLVRALLARGPDPAATVMLARLVRRQGRAAEGLALLEATPAPTGFRELSEQAMCLAALGRDDEAMAVADSAVLVAPGNGLPHRARATVHRAARRDEAALADFEMACTLDPTNIAFLELRSGQLLRLGRWAAAAESLEAMLALQPEHTGALCDLGHARRRSGDLAGAEAALQRAAALAPADWHVHLQLGHLRQAQQRPREAEAEFAAALAHNPDDPESRINLAGFRIAAGADAEAVVLLTEAHRLRPGWSQAMDPLVGLLRRLRRHAEAEALLADWCARRPRDGAKWLLLASVRREVGGDDAGPAAQALARAAQLLGEGAPPVRVERAEQQLVRGDRAAALALLQQVAADAGASAQLRQQCAHRLAQLRR